MTNATKCVCEVCIDYTIQDELITNATFQQVMNYDNTDFDPSFNGSIYDDTLEFIQTKWGIIKQAEEQIISSIQKDPTRDSCDKLLLDKELIA